MSKRLEEALKDMKEARGRVLFADSRFAYLSNTYEAAYYAAFYTSPEKLKQLTLELICLRD